MMIIVVS